MKKILILFIAIFACVANVTGIYAYDTNRNIDEYIQVIDMLNEKYNTHLYIIDEEEFNNSPLKDDYINYDQYINNIFDLDIDSFEKECLAIINEKDYYEVEMIHNSRSVMGTKTTLFNGGRNSMTLTYKYSGTKFDTTYKPTVKVNKINTSNFFSMSSYTGTFKNSNSTYSVVAKGTIYTELGITSNKSFTVNFNL